jgi:hypothetical protein
MHPSSAKFTEDLRTGQKAEAYIAIRLAQRCNGAVIPGPAGRFPGYDFSIEKRETRRYECKADLASPETGRCFIEFRCSGKPSGIASTLADWYCHIVPGKYVFVVRPKPFLEWLTRTESTTVCGGDGGRAEGYLVTVKDLLNLATSAPEWCYVLELEA